MRDLWSRLVDPPALRAFLRRLQSRNLRFALALCLPAALAAIALRGWLLAYMPAAFVHNDTSTIVETAYNLVTRGAFALDSKKTFLAPLLYCLPALLHLPVLPFMAVLQHLLGVVTVFLGGLLVFAWFRFWRWLIVPATLLLALDPVLLWYEHTALAETYAVFGILLVALTATAFYRIPNRYTLGLLLFGIFFMAGARPEGRLFALFALVLITRVLWGQWRALRIGLSISVVWVCLLFALSRTHQSGLLLLTSLIQLSPAHLSLSPDVAETLAPLASQARQDWSQPNPPKLVALRKDISNQIESHFKTHDRIDAICRKAGLEIALRNLPSLPGLALQKFVVAHRELPSGDFNTYAQGGQYDVLYVNTDEHKTLRYSHLMWGRDFANPADARAFFQTADHPIPGDALTRWLNVFVSASIASVAPWPLPGSTATDVPIHGLPWLYTAALLGLLALAFRDPRPLNFHQLWGAFLLGLWLLIMVTANIRARFRVPFEPLWIIYALALLDSLLIFAARWIPFRRPTS